MASCDRDSVGRHLYRSFGLTARRIRHLNDTPAVGDRRFVQGHARSDEDEQAGGLAPALDGGRDDAVVFNGERGPVIGGTVERDEGEANELHGRGAIDPRWRSQPPTAHGLYSSPGLLFLIA